MSLVVTDKKKLAIFILICSIILSILLSLLVFYLLQPDDDDKQPEQVMEKIETKLQLAELSQPFTQEDNPEIYQQWGNDWVDIINTMLPLSAERVYQQPECDMVEKLELSNKSIIQETPIVDVFCENEEVFSVTLNDVTQEKRLLPNSKLFGRTTDEFINACLQPIKPNLMYPDSIVPDALNTNINMDNTQQKLNIQMPITVKTGYDSHITHMVTCQVDSQLNATAQFSPMPVQNIPNNNSHTEQ